MVDRLACRRNYSANTQLLQSHIIACFSSIPGCTFWASGLACSTHQSRGGMGRSGISPRTLAITAHQTNNAETCALLLSRVHEIALLLDVRPQTLVLYACGMPGAELPWWECVKGAQMTP